MKDKCTCGGSKLGFGQVHMPGCAVLAAPATTTVSVDLLKNALKLIDAMMPGVANIALQDYAALNDVPLALRKAINDAKGGVS